MNEFDIEQQLSAAIEGRSSRVHPGLGSIRDVQARARRRARRHAVGGAGALVAVGAIGAVAVASRPEPSTRLADTPSAPGDDLNGGGNVDYWRCTGPISADSADFAPTTTVYYDEAFGSTTTTVFTRVNNFADGSYGFAQCEPVRRGVETTTTESPDFSTTTSMFGSDETSTTVEFPVFSTTTSPEAITSTTIEG